MRIVFLGTPEVAVPSLRALDAAHDVEVAAVITNPDRPRGRSRQPRPPPVKVAAEELGLTVWQPQRPSEIVDGLAALDLHAGAVVAYGAILRPEVLASAGHGLVNLHFSLLPRWRGAAPVQHAIRAGDEVTGLTTFVLDEGMDTGPILEQREVTIGPGETAGELLQRLAELGAPQLVRSVRRLVAGDEPRPQPEEGVTLAPKVERDDVAIDWSEPARDVVNLVRSANPSPGAHTRFRGEPLKVWRAHPTGETGTRGDPGTVVETGRDGPVVRAGDHPIVLTEVQPAGRASMDGASFANGYQPEPGERLGGDDG